MYDDCFILLLLPPERASVYDGMPAPEEGGELYDVVAGAELAPGEDDDALPILSKYEGMPLPDVCL
jgi:hypothetical protein